MAFDATVITSVNITQSDADMLVSWTTTAPAGTWFQVYVDRAKTWYGQATRVHLPYPGGTRVTIDVGAVLPTELLSDFSGSLPALAGGGDRALLTWQGGTYLDPSGNGDVKGFRIFGSAVAGGAIDYGHALADIAAYAQDQPGDGFGLGGFGLGGFGEANADYSWRSGPLTRGVWQFAVRSYDHAGNASGGLTVSCTIATAPRPPAPNAQGVRLTRSYNATTHVAVLSWNASPG